MPLNSRKSIRGMRDLLAEDAGKIRDIERIARDIAVLHGYSEVITPLIEYYDLLAAKIGAENRKRMFVFEDLGGRKVALRPEFTASVARLVATKMMTAPRPLRFFSFGSLYRYDEPQFGRYREFWQANFELFGSKEPEADLEMLYLTDHFLARIGLKNTSFKIGQVGILQNILAQHDIGEEKQNEILGLLDKKRWDDALKIIRGQEDSKKCVKTIEKMMQIKGKYSKVIVKNIKKALRDYPKALEKANNLICILEQSNSIDLQSDLYIDVGFARGLEYYTGMIFEVYIPELEIAIGGGGRYDNLIKMFGRGNMPSIGVALGIDRISLALTRQTYEMPATKTKQILIIPVSKAMIPYAFRISSLIMNYGVSAEVEIMGRSVSKALSDADRRGMSHSIIVGIRELEKETVRIRNMETREEKIIKISDLENLSNNVYFSN